MIGPESTTHLVIGREQREDRPTMLATSSSPLCFSLIRPRSLLTWLEEQTNGLKEGLEELSLKSVLV